MYTYTKDFVYVYVYRTLNMHASIRFCYLDPTGCDQAGLHK